MMPGIVFVMMKIVISIIQALIGYQYCDMVFRKRDEIRLPSIICWLLAAIPLFTVSVFGNPWVNMIGSAVTYLVMFVLVYQVSIQQAVIHAILYTAVMCICELIVVPLQIDGLKKLLDYNQYSEGLILLAFIILILEFLAARVMGCVFVSRKAGKKLEKRYYLINLVPVLSLVLLLVMLFLLMNHKLPEGYQIAVSGSGVAVLIINIIVFWEYGRIQKDSHEKTEMQVLLQKKNDEVAYYKLLQEQDEKLRLLRHDFKKHLSSIRELYGRGETKEADRYVEDLEKQMDRIGHRYCENVVLDLMMNHYATAFSEKDVSFSADIRTETIENMQRDDITSLFGNLLENAYEATANLPGSYVEFSVTRTKDGEATLITMVNTCDKDPFIDGEPVSTKESSGEHGYGIKSIRQVVRKYHGEINMYYRSTSTGDSSEGEFHTVIRMS